MNACMLCTYIISSGDWSLKYFLSNGASWQRLFKHKLDNTVFTRISATALIKFVDLSRAALIQWQRLFKLVILGKKKENSTTFLIDSNLFALFLCF